MLESHSPPEVSVLMTSFNYERYIGAAIRSVLEQTLADWELIIVDDASTDASWDVIQGFQDPRIKACRQPANAGACAAYNRALAMARGSAIASLDSDDLYFPEKLRRQTDFLREHPDIDVCGSFVAEIDASGNPSSNEKTFENWFNVAIDLNDPASWIWQNRLCHSGAMIRTGLHRELGGFAENLTYTPDWQFWIRALGAGARFAIIPEVLVGYRNHDRNITHKEPVAALREHSVTLATILIPWLESRGRADLIEQALAGLVRRLALVEGDELHAEMANTLLRGDSAGSARAIALKMLVTPRRLQNARGGEGGSSEGEWNALRARLEELTVSSQWHAQQSTAWQACAAEAEKSMEEMRVRLRDAHAALNASEAQLNQLRGHWALRIARLVTGTRNVRG